MALHLSQAPLLPNITQERGQSFTGEKEFPSSLNIHVQSLGLCSSTPSPRGTSGNPTYLSSFLLDTNITTAPQSIHFTAVYINLGAALTLLPQVGSSKEEQARLSASLHMLLCVFSFHIINPTALLSTFIYSPGTQPAGLLFLHMHTDASRAVTKAKASVLFPEPFSTMASQQWVPCPPSKGWSIFHCLKLPRPQGAGGNKTVFDLAKAKISEVKGQMRNL